MLKIAIIEDDTNISALIKLILQPLSQEIDIFSNGWQGMDEVSARSYDLLILDLMLPGLNGLELCRQLRHRGNTTPILMITAKAEEEDKVTGLDIGADDYITKPFNNKELFARAKALLRRTNIQQLASQSQRKNINIGRLKIDFINTTVYKDNQEIVLTSKEFELLTVFAEQPGRNFTRADLLERVWGENFEGLEHTVNSTINRLRAKIENDMSKPQYIVTVWGMGYKLNKNPDL
jgi:DNA-binding response OmpR family regulator